jgi:hypothetical protein
VSSAEAGDQRGIQPIGLVTSQFAVAERLDLAWINDADRDLLAIQEGGEIEAPIAGGLHAGVQRCGRVRAMLVEPGFQLDEAGFGVGEVCPALLLRDAEMHVELGLGDIDPENVHDSPPSMRCSAFLKPTL